MNIADIERIQSPALISQLNVRPVFDVNANVQGRDLYGVSKDIEGARPGQSASLRADHHHPDRPDRHDG